MENASSILVIHGLCYLASDHLKILFGTAHTPNSNFDIV